MENATKEEVEIALTTAINAGYRHIDTAYLYQNEKHIGDCLQKLFNEGIVKREDLFIVTKLPMIAIRAEHVEEYLKRSLEALQLSYVDLYLIHFPVGLKNHGPYNLIPKDENGKYDVDMETDHISVWKVMEDQVDAGRTKFIGVSNFNIRQMRRLMDNCRIPISNLQIEFHVYLQQPELVAFCKENNITVCAYSPLGSPGYIQAQSPESASPIADPVIVEIANKYSKLPAQILLRYLLEYGVAVIPKSINPARIQQNIEIFDFELTEEECEQIKGLDRGENGRIFGPKSSPVIGDMVNHPEQPFPI